MEVDRSLAGQGQNRIRNDGQIRNTEKPVKSSRTKPFGQVSTGWMLWNFVLSCPRDNFAVGGNHCAYPVAAAEQNFAALN